MTDRLERALTKSFQGLEKHSEEIRGRLGLTISGKEMVEVTGRPGFVYVRLRDSLSEVIQARNTQVSATYDLQVIVIRSRNAWAIKGVDTEIYGSMKSDTAYIPHHGFTHEFGSDGRPVGNDVVFVYPDQIMPLLVSPSGTYGTMQLYVSPAPFKLHTGGWVYAGDVMTPSFAPYVPNGSTGIMGLVYINSDTGSIGITINTGTTFSNSIIDIETLIHYIPLPGTNQEPLKGVRLVSGTTALGWDHLYDVRQWLGGGGSGGGVSSETDPVFLASEAHNFVAGDKAKLSGIQAGAQVNNISDANAMLLVSGTNITLHTHPGGGGGAYWGGITGTISAQTDLQNALDAKLTKAMGVVGRMVITDASGTVTTASNLLYDLTNKIMVQGATSAVVGGTNSQELVGDGAAAGGVVAAFGTAVTSFLALVRGRGTKASPAAIQSGDVIGAVRGRAFYASGTGNLSNTQVDIEMIATQNWSAGNLGCKVVISTTPNGSTTKTAVLTIDQDGTINIPSGKTYNINGSPHAHTVSEIGVRERLTASRMYYVRTDGSDSNTGLVNSAGGAFLTVQRAIDVASALDNGGYDITISLGNGSYTENLILKSGVGSGKITILGNTTTPSSVALQCSSGKLIEATNVLTTYILNSFKCLGSGSANIAIYAAQNSYLEIRFVEFSTGFASYHVETLDGGMVTFTGDYKITGGCTAHLACFQGSIRCQSLTVTITGTPAFSQAFCRASSSGATIWANGNTYSGSATGVHYNINMNATVFALGGATYFPGNSAGTTATGGQYA